MAFKKSDSTSSSSNNNGIPANKKAVGYINVYLPTTGGGKRKVGSIILREMFANERALAEWFAVDPAARAEIFLKQVIVEYNGATPAEGSEFDLPEA